MSTVKIRRIVSVYPSSVFAHWAVTVAGSVAPIGSLNRLPSRWGDKTITRLDDVVLKASSEQERQHEEGLGGNGNTETTVGRGKWSEKEDDKKKKGVERMMEGEKSDDGQVDREKKKRGGEEGEKLVRA